MHSPTTTHTPSEPDEPGRRLQRAIVMQTLRSDRNAHWTRAGLEAELGDTDPAAVADALVELHQAGVLNCIDDEVRCSRTTIHLDELELIAI